MRLVAGLLLLALTVACASTPEQEAVLSADAQYSRAVASYEAGDHSEAIQLLQTFTFNYPQDPRIVDARWLMAEAYYGAEDWATAAQEYLNFQRDYIDAERADDALYQAGRSYQQMSLRPELDQGETLRSINVYERLLAEYPGSEFIDEARSRRSELRDKLAEKLFLNAEFYFDDEDFQAAEIYLTDLIERYPDSSWLPPSYALLARTYCEEGFTDRAAEVFDRLEEGFPDSSAVVEVADELPEQCRRIAGATTRTAEGDNRR